MLVFSSYVPYLPILPGVGDVEHKEKVKNTLVAYKTLEEDLYASKPDVVLVLTKHGDMLPDAFSASLSSTFRTSFEELGNFDVSMDIKCDTEFLQRIKEKMMTTIPLVLFTEEKLAYTFSPLHYLMKSHKYPIVPLYYSMLDNHDHFLFGQMLREVIEESGKRVAIVAIGNLSHCVTQFGPGKYNEAGKKFDQKIVNALKKDKKGLVMKIEDDLIKKAQECGMKTLLMLLGVLEEYNVKTDILEYEYPFGVGYLTVNFKLY